VANSYIKSIKSLPYLKRLSFLLGIDIILIFLSALRLIIRRYVDTYQGVLLSDFFSIIHDRSLGEFFQYFKEFAIVVLFFLLLRRTSQRIYFAWALIFLFILFDDSLKIHETFGAFFSSKFSTIDFWSFRAQDVGEMIVFGGVGLLLALILVPGYLKTDREHKLRSHVLLVLVFFLAIFGVFLDVLISFFDWYELRMVFHLIEDGGEMIVMSIILWITFIYHKNDLPIDLPEN